MAFTVVVRVGPRVSRIRQETLPAALDALDLELRTLGEAARRGHQKAFTREYEPVQQVSARGEIVHGGRLFGKVLGGIDVRGDGSSEAWVGRVSRELLERRRSEEPIDALRRRLLEDR